MYSIKGSVEFIIVCFLCVCVGGGSEQNLQHHGHSKLVIVKCLYRMNPKCIIIIIPFML